MTEQQDPLSQSYDVVIIGSGAGGGTLAYSMAVNHKKKVLLIEQGIIGGQTKKYGAALYRFRKKDFEEVIYPDGVSPAWPISYDDLEPYYCQAESIYRVHGETEKDPTEPYHSNPYPYKAIYHEPFIKPFLNALQGQGLHVSHLPRALDLHENGKCTFCGKCDDYICSLDAKFDTEIACIKPALLSGNLQLIRARCLKILTNNMGNKVTGLDLEYQGKVRSVDAKVYVVSCGTFNSAILLFNSKNKQHPRGLANSSDLLGRHLSGKNASIYMLPVKEKIPDEFHQKTFAVNDFYLGNDSYSFPMGTMQAPGRLPIWKHINEKLRPEARKLAEKSLTCYTMSEIWPDPDNRIGLDEDGNLGAAFETNNLQVAKKMHSTFMKIFKKAGYTETVGYKIESPWHMVGTVRFGNDPATSVLNTNCRTHDISNLYVVDGSFFPSSGAMNVSLTIMAQALKTGDYINKELNN